MPAPRVLFVKLSSLGDVVHNFPAVTELAAHVPGIGISWAVEEAFADLVRLHPAVGDVLPVGLRGLRARPWALERWRGVGLTRRRLAAGAFDYVVDTQGLVKSAVVAWAAKRVAFGPDRASAREKAAARFYDVKLPVPRGRHAVERNRLLVGQVFGYVPRGPADYGLVPPPAAPAWAPPAPYCVMLHAASRANKRWPEDRWVALARMLADRGCAAVYPGGTGAEREAAARLASQSPGGLAAPATGLAEAASLLGHAACVAGVDTGLTHLAVALGRPAVGIYGATRPELTGLHGANTVNLGGPGRFPTVDEVARALLPALA